MERLDKFIASQTGLSRTQVHEKLRVGAVRVNGAVERKKDRKIDPNNDAVCLDGEEISYRKFLYIMMNKPAGLVSASRDPKMKTVIDILPPEMKRKGLFPAGRLDRDTTGLLIITDDGDLAHKMLAPGKGVFKSYLAALDGPVGDREKEMFAKGIEIDGGELCLPAYLDIAEDGMSAVIRICEGKYHQVKRMFEAVGRRVVALKRLSIGALSLDESLGEGECRFLDESERDRLLTN